MLAAMGAEVIKIDDPKTGDPTAFAPPFDGPRGVAFERASDADMGINYLKRARGKRSITLDLKSTAGREIFLKMAARADVVIENFSAGVATRLGIAYPDLRAVNPRLVYCSINGYGSNGPARATKAYDTMVQAAVGFMSMTGDPAGAPAKAASPLSDAISGSFAAHGVIAALLHRERTGEGQEVEVAMADCLFSLIFDEPIDCYERLGLAPRQGNRIMRFSPFNAYQARDGWVVIGTATNAEWALLLDVMGRADIKRDADMMRVEWRITHNDAVDHVVGQWVGERTKAQVVDALDAAGVPCSPVRSADEVMRWEQLHAREMILPMINPLRGVPAAAAAPGFPIKFSATPANYDTPAPIPGADTEAMLARFLGLDSGEIARLREQGVI